jgi:predicted peptidase
MRIVAAVTVCLIAGLPATTTNPEPTARSFSRSVEFAGEYLLSLPPGYEDGERDWPLLVFLHGAGERGDDVQRVAIHWPPKIAGPGDDFPFVVVAPLCAKGAIWSPERILTLVDHAIEEFRIDESRIYLTGLSMGGFGTWATAARAPDRFAAIAPVCGGGSFIEGWGLRNRVPVWAFHGAEDRTVPVEESKRMVEIVERFGGEAKLTVYDGVGHDAWNRAYAEPELWKWLLGHRRGDRR